MSENWKKSAYLEFFGPNLKLCIFEVHAPRSHGPRTLKYNKRVHLLKYCNVDILALTRAKSSTLQ